MRIFLLMLGSLVLVACGSGGGDQRAVDQHILGELDKFEKSFQDASNSEQERAAISNLNRQCQDGGYTYLLSLFDSAGATIPVNEWSKDRARLKDASVELEVRYRDPRLKRTFRHQLIDPENFVYLLME
jgi:hypothetical protein